MESVDQVTVLVTGEPPRYARPGDAGMDLVSRVDFTLEPGQRMLVPTGVSLAMPPGYVGLVTPRSGLAVRHGISMVNAPGIIDAGFRGEIQVILWNTDAAQSFQAHAGDRIAQLVIVRHSVATPLQVQTLPGSDRGEGGFGSTGVAGGSQT